MRLYLRCWLAGGMVALVFLAGRWLGNPVLRQAGWGPLGLLWLLAGLAFAAGLWGTALAMLAED